MRRVYLLILVLAATAAGASLAGWAPHAAGGAAPAPVETPQRPAQQDCTADDDVSVAISDQWGVVERLTYTLEDPPDYKAGDDIGIYYDITNSSCRDVRVTVDLKGSVTEATIHNTDETDDMACLEGCTISAGDTLYGNVGWDLAQHPNATGEKVVAAVTVTAPDDFTDANPGNNSATSTQAINIVNEAPDIAVKSVKASKTTVVIGEAVDFTVVVKNDGNADAETDTTVTLHLGDGTDELDSDTVSLLADGPDKTVTLSWDTNGAEAGKHTLRALAQTEGDGNADNDSETVTVTLLEPSVDVAVKSVTASATEALVGDTITFTVALKNAGNAVAPWPEVSLFDPNAAADAAPLASQTADVSIPAGGEITVEILWDTSETAAGERNLRVQAQTRRDDNPDNDSASVAVTLIAPVDVTISVAETRADTAIAGNSLSVPFTLTNLSEHDAGEVTVSLYVIPEGEERGDAEPTATTTESTVAAGDTATGTIDWDTADVAVGRYDLEVVIQTIGDIDATNNAASASIEIRNWLLLKNVSPTSAAAVSGNTVEFTAQVENVGTGELTGVTVGLYESENDDALADMDFASIAAGGTADATVRWATAGWDAGQVELFVTVVADGQAGDGDDKQSVKVTIRNPIELLSATPASADNIAGTSVLINVEVLNESDVAVTDVEVKLDVVKDCENEDDEEKEQKIGCATIAAIPAGEKGAAVLEWDTAGVAAGQHELKVIASMDNYSVDDNDERSLTISLREPVMDVALTAANLNRSAAAVGQTLDVVATVINHGEVPVAVPVTLYTVQDYGSEERTTEVSKKTSPLIAPGSSEKVTLPWDTTGKPSGEYNLEVSVHLPDDPTRDDNTGALTAELFASAFEGDDAPESCVEDVRANVNEVRDLNGQQRSPPDYQVGEYLRLSYIIYNYSCAADVQVSIAMTHDGGDEDIDGGGALCFSACRIPYGSKAEGEVAWTIPSSLALERPVSVALTVEGPDGFTDVNPANDTSDAPMNIVHPNDVVVRLGEERGNKVSTGQSLGGPEFGTVNVRLVSVDPLQITLPFADETFQVSVKVANDGTTTEPAAVGFLWENQDGIAGEELHNHTLIIPAGQTKTESIAVPIGSLPPGSHRIKVELASAATNVSSENAPRHLELARQEPLVNVKMEDVVVSPDVLMLGDNATVSLMVQNNSEITLPLRLELYVDDDAEPIGRETIDELAPDVQSQEQITWSIPASGKHLGRHGLRLSAVSEKYGAIALWETEVIFHIDAEIMEIRSSPTDTAMQGEEVAIEVDVQNNGPATANIPVVVRLSSDATFTDDRRPPVPSQSSGTARFTWRTRDYKAAEHTIRAEVPSEHNIATGKKSMELPFRINPMVIQASIETVSPYPQDPFVGEPVYISVTVRNDGPVATRIPITLHFPPGGRQPETRKPYVHPGQTETETFEWRTGNYRPGTHQFRIAAAAVGNPVEYLNVELSPPVVSATIVDAGTYPVETAMVGEPVEVWVDVRNDGPVAVRVPVQLAFPSDEKKPEQDSERIQPGEIARYSFTWKTSNYEPGIHTLSAAILLDNNATFGPTTDEIRFALTPLIINATILDIAVSPEAPRIGEPVTITVKVRNDGRIAANIPVILHYPSDEKRPETRRPRVDVGDIGEAVFMWRTGRYTPGIHDFRVEVPNDPPLSRQFTVELLPPTVNVAIVGIGSDPAETAFKGQAVKIWVDVINNGPSALNVPVQLAFPSNDKQPERKSTRVEPGEITRVEFVWKTANYEIGDHLLTATLMAEHNITELDASDTIQIALVPAQLMASIIDISWNPESPAVGEPVRITVTVRNDGLIAAKIPVTVHFPPGGRQPETRSPRVDPGRTGTATFDWPTGNFAVGTHQFRVELVDVDVADQRFTIDLLPTVENVAIVGMGTYPVETAMVGEPVEVWVDVRNDGPVAVRVPVQLAFPSDEKKPEQDSERIQPGEIARYSFTWKTSNYEPGIHTLSAAILLDNNATFGPTTDEIRFALTPLIINATILDIAVSPEAPRIGEPVTITVKVRNDGRIAANIPVILHYPSDEKRPETRRPRVDVGDIGEAVFMWRTGRYTPGIHDFRVEVPNDPPLSRQFTVELLPPTVNVAIVGIGSDPAETAFKGQAVKIWVDVINNGPSALNVPVQLAFPSSDKQPERKSPRVEPGRTARVEFTWKTSNYDTGIYTFTAALQAEYNITELAIFATIQIRLVSPQLAASIVDISWHPASPVVGEPVSITVTVRNNGSVAANIPVTLYFPSGDKRPETKRPRVAPGTVGSADFTWRTSRYEPGDHVFRVQIPGVGGAFRTFEIELRPPEVDFAVVSFRTPDPLHPIVKGDWVEITVGLQNQGPYAGRGTVYLLNGANPDAMYEQSASLEPGEFREVEFTWKTLRYPVGEYDLLVWVDAEHDADPGNDHSDPARVRLLTNRDITVGFGNVARPAVFAEATSEAALRAAPWYSNDIQIAGVDRFPIDRTMGPASGPPMGVSPQPTGGDYDPTRMYWRWRSAQVSPWECARYQQAIGKSLPRAVVCPKAPALVR